MLQDLAWVATGPSANCCHWTGAINRIEFHLLLFACLLMPAHFATASTSGATLDLDLDALRQVVVTTASREQESLLKAPGTVVVISRQHIRERGYFTLQDILQDLPGIDLHKYADTDTYNRIAIRGIYGNNKFIILQNGVRISSPTGEPIPVQFNFPLHGIKQVEIVYGPASALYGADAFTGVINLITEVPTQEQSLRVGGAAGDARFRYGYLTGTSRFTDDLALTFGLSAQRSDNPNLAAANPAQFQLADLKIGNNTVVPANQRSYWAPSAGRNAYLRLALGQEFALGLVHSYFRHPTSTVELPDHTNYNAHPALGTTLNTAYGAWQRGLGERYRMEIQSNFSQYELDPDSAYANSFVNYQSGYKYARGDKGEIEGRLTYQAGDVHQLTGGVLFQRFYSLPKTADLERPYDRGKGANDQNLFYLGTDQTLPVRVFELRYRNIGIYLQDRMRWNARLISTLGIRYDRSSTYGGSVNPRLSLVYQASADTTWKLLYGTAFLAPAPFFTHQHFGAFSGNKDAQGRYTANYFYVPNPDLKPERMRTLEMHLNHAFSRQFKMDLTLYYLRAERLFGGGLLSSTPQSDFIPGGYIQLTQTTDNIGTAKARGLDVSLTYETLLPTGRLKVWGVYSAVSGGLHDTTRSTEVDLPYAARQKARIGLTYHHAGQWFVTPSLSCSSRVPVDNTNTRLLGQPDKFSPGYAIAHLFAGMDITDQARLFLKIDNLFDRRYYNPGVAVDVNFSASPQAPRTVFAGLEWGF
ncbi:TonB-dependent receptor [Chitinivorax sp. B]|uniref:TonB-dependent receptor plug domain-containing protein n=1 Tax=Chitinivorax sp. B TaxID=2502235 RepID=UPI00148504A4|nr:TonB-dependent receptor [Chitinivorax sp. B]